MSVLLAAICRPDPCRFRPPRRTGLIRHPDGHRA